MRYLLPVLMVWLSAACASPIRTQPLACGAEAEDAELSNLAAAACRGEVEAMLKLATFYEIGDRVPRNLDVAEVYYKGVLSQPRGQSQIYVPPAGDVPGFILPIETPQAPSIGTEQAQFGLGRLLLCGRDQPQKARKWMQRAAKRGMTRAADILRGLEKGTDTDALCAFAYS